MTAYFEKYESVLPPEPIPHSIPRELLWQFLATMSLGVGFWYIAWRWTDSLNPEALWFAVPLATAETFAYVGLILFVINLWAVRDIPMKEPPSSIRQCVSEPDAFEDRPLQVDIFFPTYDEDPELVRLSILDAKAMDYPHPLSLTIHVLDDGKRPAMAEVARQEGVNYITRDSNIGFKAGNLRNAMEQTFGDFIVICDADTRPFPTMLRRTLGYFRDPDVAWVQTPQWFFELPPGTPLAQVMKRRLGTPGHLLGRGIEKIVGPVMVGEDPFCNSPQMFYDVIQRRRNWANASFCCGAGSIHRREAVMEAALKSYSTAMDRFIGNITRDIKDLSLKSDLTEAMQRELALETELTPYKFHVSEDMYTSIILHSDPDRQWKSVFHPPIESKMLSTQDLVSWAVQRFKYAGGTIDVALNDNPLFRRGMTIPQKLMYASTFWSYLGCIWNVIFLAAPIIYLFTGIAPVAAYSMDFYKHVLPFLFLNTLATMVGTWGVAAWSGQSFYLSFFPINFRALTTVLRGKKISFPVTPKTRQEGNFAHLVVPQILVMVLTAAGLVYAGLMAWAGRFDNVNGLLTNAFWGANNILAMWGIVAAAFWKPDPNDEGETP
ncbi:glycosyltransferase family 2 protein [Desulfoluna butyratoxydans]|uniref:Nucleotide-diphospho-sugar transferases n=1 Tax=Desulfoluna butyratoxydans TaxID=231438 RepID=A0A4U8YP04_9BACT|nr:cellulose synthase catalytic subunit [Desulfoluna butyratoxydans]VFQ42953.1 nucleotide-diphospho-sugar transferases [Desulfoluna butyratoxydans]